MIERLKENGVETQIEKQAPQHEQHGAPNLGHVEMFIDQEALAQESPSRQIIAGMYREDGNYEGVDTSEQEQALVKATRSSKYSAAKATKDEAFADYLGVEPAARVIREAAKEPLIDDQYNRARARIEEKVKNLKRQIADFNAEVESRYSKETAKIDNRYENIYRKETADLTEKFGPSFADRLEALNKQKAKDIGNKIVAKVSVDSSKAEAQEEIAESNRTAAGVDAGDASDESLILATARLAEESEARNKRIEDWRQEQEDTKVIEGREVVVFANDVEVDADKVRAASELPFYSEERQKILAPLDEAVEKVNEILGDKPRRRGLFGRAADKMNKALIGFSMRNMNKSPEEIKKNRLKRAGVALGVMAVGAAAAYLFKDHGHDFGLSGMFGQGHEGNAHDAHQAVGTHATTGTHSAGVESQVYGPAVPDHTVTAPAQETVINTAPVSSPHIPQEVTLSPGQTVSDYVAGYINKAYPHASAQQVDSMIREGNAYMMYSNGFTMADTHNIAAGAHFDTSSLVRHFPGA